MHLITILLYVLVGSSDIPQEVSNMEKALLLCLINPQKKQKSLGVKTPKQVCRVPSVLF